MEFYRVYHIDAKGGTAALTNFTADNDTLACERAGAIVAASQWPGMELWERMRQIHCHGVTRTTASVPDFPSEKIAVTQR